MINLNFLSDRYVAHCLSGTSMALGFSRLAEGEALARIKGQISGSPSLFMLRNGHVLRLRMNGEAFELDRERLSCRLVADAVDPDYLMYFEQSLVIADDASRKIRFTAQIVFLDGHHETWLSGASSDLEDHLQRPRFMRVDRNRLEILRPYPYDIPGTVLDPRAQQQAQVVIEQLRTQPGHKIDQFLRVSSDQW